MLFSILDPSVPCAFHPAQAHPQTLRGFVQVQIRAQTAPRVWNLVWNFSSQELIWAVESKRPELFISQ